MRAKIAKRAKGHPFEKRFLELDGIKLAIAYRQALRDEEEEFELIKTLNEAWAKRFEEFFRVLYMFVDRDMYRTMEELKKIKELEQEVKPEEFPELWEELMQTLPSEIIVEEPTADPYETIPKIDKETEMALTGFLPYFEKKEGE